MEKIGSLVYFLSPPFLLSVGCVWPWVFHASQYHKDGEDISKDTHVYAKRLSFLCTMTLFDYSQKPMKWSKSFWLIEREKKYFWLGSWGCFFRKLFQANLQFTSHLAWLCLTSAEHGIFQLILWLDMFLSSNQYVVVRGIFFNLILLHEACEKRKGKK